jgi:hypothetical protein
MVRLPVGSGNRTQEGSLKVTKTDAKAKTKSRRQRESR